MGPALAGKRGCTGVFRGGCFKVGVRSDLQIESGHMVTDIANYCGFQAGRIVADSKVISAFSFS